MDALTRPSRSDRTPRGAGEDPRPGARADSSRAHARVAVRVLSRRGADHGRRSRVDAEFRHHGATLRRRAPVELRALRNARTTARVRRDRKSTRLNSSHVEISYAVFCLKKKKNK